MTQGGSVVVVGSLTMDFTARAVRMPERGETVLGDGFTMVPGGKGANQAVCAARQGATVAMVGCVGDDSTASLITAGLSAEGDRLQSFLTRVAGPSGVAHIVVDHAGDNRIIMVPLANSKLTPDIVARHAWLIGRASVLLVQLEVPVDAVSAALVIAKGAGVTTILNPAPARTLETELLSMCDLVVPNETEAELLSDHDASTYEGALKAARRLQDMGAREVVVTRGAAGSLYLDAAGIDLAVPAFPVTSVDATAAGDAFCGGLAAGLADGLGMRCALQRAAACGALATTVPGALPSLPRREAVDELVGWSGAM